MGMGGDHIGAGTAVPDDHLVQFYDGDGHLAAPVARYLLEALRCGGTGVVLASRQHRGAVAARLAAQGANLEEARGSGALVERDAAEMVAAVQRGRGVDQRYCDQVVGDVVASAVRRGGPVRIFGELVALLGEERGLGAALQLEAWWNALAARAPFSLYCAYPGWMARDPYAVRRLAEAHSAVHAARLPLPMADRSRPAQVIEFFDPSVTGVAAARRLVAEVLRPWATRSLIADAELVVSELATNALLHTEGGFALAVSRTTGAVRVAVADSSRQLPVRRDLGTGAQSGRGLLIVEALARGWGSEPRTHGKLVWAELGV